MLIKEYLIHYPENNLMGGGGGERGIRKFMIHIKMWFLVESVTHFSGFFFFFLE